METKHRYLTDSGGSLITFARMTGEKCPACNPTSQGARLGVLVETHNTETILCEKCDYSLTRPKKNPPEKRMNDGAKPSGNA